MNLTVLAEAPLIIQIHVAAALPALLLGPVALLRRQRDWLHRLAGRLWVLAMIVLAGSSLLIHEARQLGPFSLIHILSVLTLCGLWQGVAAIRRRDIALHQRFMRMVYLQAVILAGVFTFLPGRRMNALLSGEAPHVGFALAGLTGCVVIWLVWREGRKALL